MKKLLLLVLILSNCGSQSPKKDPYTTLSPTPVPTPYDMNCYRKCGQGNQDHPYYYVRCQDQCWK